ncbi:unnamed protein product, partial [Rotaria sp. Silwood1]
EYFSYNRISSLSDPILDQFCLHILSNIEHKIKWFNLKASSIECILLAGNYSNLSEHDIYNIIKENALYLVIVDCVDDCLHLLDGRFDQFRVLSPRSRTISIIHKEKLLNLKCFSLSCNLKIYFYDEAVIPFLHRMPNLEELRFYFKCSRKKSFVDGNDLTANIIKHSNQIDLLTNEHIENTFRGFPNNQIIF